MIARTFRCLSIFMIVALFGAGASLAGARDDRRLSFELESVDGLLSVASTAIGSLAAGLFEEGLSCDSRVDGEVYQALRQLERRGEGARYRFEDGGDRVTLRRRGGQIKVRLEPEDGRRIDLSAPWVLARCLLGDGGRIELPKDLELSVKSRDSRLEIRLD